MRHVGQRGTCGLATAALLLLAGSAAAQTAFALPDGAVPIAVLEPLTRRASCLVEANSVIKLAAATQGTISRVTMERGQVVKVGEVVAQLESEVEQAMLEGAELRANSDTLVRSRKTEMELAASKLARIRELSKRNVSSQQQLEQSSAEAQVAAMAFEQAKFERDLAVVEAKRMRATIERRLVRSPVNGVVTKVEQRVGEFADPARPLAEIAEVHVLRVEAYLPVEAYPHLKPGMRAAVRIADPVGVLRMAEVLTKDPQIDAASSLFQVTLRLPNEAGDVPAGVRCSLVFIQ
jgi:RND family efflux transporter MFP subunit